MFCEVNGLLQSVLLAGGEGRAWAVKYWMNDRKRKNPPTLNIFAFILGKLDIRKYN